MSSVFQCTTIFEKNVFNTLLQGILNFEFVINKNYSSEKRKKSSEIPTLEYTVHLLTATNSLTNIGTNPIVETTASTLKIIRVLVIIKN